MVKKNKKKGKDEDNYGIYMRIRDDGIDESNQHNTSFVNLLNSMCSFESQSGACFDSVNQSDGGYELFSVGVKSFKEAKDIALKCSLLWKVGAVDLRVNDHNVCIKYAEPTSLPHDIPTDIPVLSETYHLNKYKDKYQVYKIIMFDLSGIDTVDDFLSIRTKELKSKTIVDDEIDIMLGKEKQSGGSPFLYQRIKADYLNIKCKHSSNR